MQALVDAVRLRVRVFDAGHQNLGLRERLRERGDERNRSPDTGMDRVAPPCGPESLAGHVVDGAGGIDRVRLAEVTGSDGDAGAPRCV